MKVNLDKFHIVLSARNINHVIIFIEKLSITCCENVLGIKSDNEHSFEKNVERLCKAKKIVNAVAWISTLIKFEQRRSIVNSFITSYFSYSPLVFMFHSRRLNRCVNYAYRSTFRIIYQDYKLSSTELRNGRSVNHSNRQSILKSWQEYLPGNLHLCHSPRYSKRFWSWHAQNLVGGPGNWSIFGTPKIQNTT